MAHCGHEHLTNTGAYRDPESFYACDDCGLTFGVNIPDEEAFPDDDEEDESEEQ